MQKFTDSRELNDFLEENKNSHFIFFISQEFETFSGIESDEVSVEKLVEADMEGFCSSDYTEDTFEEEKEKERVRLAAAYEIFTLDCIIEADGKEALLCLIAESL